MERLIVPEVKPIGGSPEEIARETDRRRRGLLDRVIDAHTHLWPDGFYRAILRWFDDHAWKIHQRGRAEQAVLALRREGVGTNLALVYAHKPGIARMLNAFVADVCRADPNVVGVGTVMPGEPDARTIVREAIDYHHLRGIKIHCHVQRISIDDPRTIDVLAECEAIGVPAIVHAGREPRSPGYGVDPYDVCNVRRTEKVLRLLPRLKLVIAHLGLDEIKEHFALLCSYENLHLDTAMACAEYFDVPVDYRDIERLSDRILYGSDYPIVPYDTPARELCVLARHIVSDEAFERIVRTNAKRLWSL
jgi:hypothetical protein